MNSITVDSSQCLSYLCSLCAEAGTDKSPLNTQGHRHPYSSIYSLLFEPIKHKPVKFGEIGIAYGCSLLVWSTFFPQGKIYGYDCDPKNLTISSNRNIPNTTIHMMDANDPPNIVERLKEDTKDGELFDVLMDDASHEIATQCTLLRNVLPFLKTGGIYIIEDIYRDSSTEEFEKAFQEVKHMVRFHTFILCEHENRYSPGANNDKLLVLIKN